MKYNLWGACLLPFWKDALKLALFFSLEESMRKDLGIDGGAFAYTLSFVTTMLGLIKVVVVVAEWHKMKDYPTLSFFKYLGYVFSLSFYIWIISTLPPLQIISSKKATAQPVFLIWQEAAALPIQEFSKQRLSQYEIRLTETAAASVIFFIRLVMMATMPSDVMPPQPTITTNPHPHCASDCLDWALASWLQYPLIVESGYYGVLPNHVANFQPLAAAVWVLGFCWFLWQCPWMCWIGTTSGQLQLVSFQIFSRMQMMGTVVR
jgi:hypothetical protein